MPLRFYILLTHLFLVTQFFGQGGTYPVQINSILNPPNSIYLEDYYAPGGNSWMMNLTLLDLNEPSRDVYLRLSIESGSATLTSKPGFIPTNDIITLLPGIPVQISGADLAAYFTPQSMDISGSSWSQIQQNGRLPEDFYQFCVEVIDYQSGEVLSQKNCGASWIQLNDEPLINTPMCDAVIDPSIPTNIMFQWQSTNLLSLNSLNSTEYQLTVFEITNPNSSPLNAVSNGEVIQIFQSPWQTTPYYLYTTSDPILELGKGYAFTVQARDVSGRDLFKNNGYSQMCWFWYGYPEGGNIELYTPADSAGFSKYSPQYFSWNAPSNVLNNQGIEYEIIIKEKDELQSKQDAIVNNPIWHSNLFPINYMGTGRDYELDKSIKAFDKAQEYVWYVQSKTGNQITAQSEVRQFMGPPLVDEFFVNQKRVEVTSLSTKDLNNLSGIGLVSLDANGTYMAEVEFNHISLTELAGIHYMTSGFVEGMLEDSIEVDLMANLPENGTATGYIKGVHLSVEGDLKVLTRLEWDLPHLSNSPGVPKIISKDTWINYFNYLLTGPAELAYNQSYELLDPFGFTLNMDHQSTFITNNNQFDLNLSGNVFAPLNVKGVDEDVRVTFHFSDHDQLRYLNGWQQGLYNRIVPVGEANIRVSPNQYTIDLSDDISPDRFLSQPNWKGIYMDEFQLSFTPANYGASSTLQFTSSIDKSITLASNDSVIAWITNDGLNLRVNEPFTNNEAITFNTFPGGINSLNLEIINSSVSNSYLTGDIAIPVLSESEAFTFTVPLTETGYNQGYLDENLDEREFVFNNGNGDQEINLTINRAVFADNSKILMNLDIEWPNFDFSLESVDGFTVWGNYDIGFVTPNGHSALINQANGKASDNDITVDYIGAGRDANLYSIGISGTIMMGEDVSGENGAPIFSAFSIFESSIIPENYQPYFDETTPVGVLPEYVQGQGGGEGPTLDEGNDIGQINNAINMFGNYLGNMSNAQFEDTTGNATTLDDLFPEELDESNPMDDGEITLEKIILYIDIVQPFLPEEKQQKAAELKQKLEALNNSELMEIYYEIKENGFNLNKILKAQVDKLADRLNGKITAEMDTINMKIENAILSPVDTLLFRVNDFIDETITELTDNLIDLLGEGNESAVNIIVDARESTINNVTGSLYTSVHNSVKTNVTDKITTTIDTIFTKRVTEFIENQITSLGYAIIDKDFESLSVDTMLNNMETLITEMGEDVVTVFKSISLQGVKNTCEDIVVDAYEGINWQQIGENIKTDILNSIESEAAALITDALTDIIGDNFAGDVVAGLMDNVEFDFTNLGEKIENGEIGDIVSFNPTNIVIKSKIADIKGQLEFTADDPVWGDSWQAMLDVDVKKPEVSLYGHFLNGKVDGFNFWFVEVSVPHGLDVPVFSGVTLDGIGGKVFRHMSYDLENGTYLPDETAKYGVGVGMFLIDNSGPTSGQAMRMDVDAEVTVMEDYFTMQIRGDVGMAYEDNDLTKSIHSGVASGTGYLGYSTLDNTLLGQFNAQTNIAPLLCANGEMGLHVSPDYWNFYAGTQENPMTAKVLCLNAISVQSWFDIDNAGLELGLQADIDIWARSPWIKIGRYWRPYAGFEFHFLTAVDVQFQPTVSLQEAILYLYMNSEVGVDWEKRDNDGNVTDSGNWVLAGIYLEGEAHYVNRPSEAYIYGHLAGAMTVIGIGIDFDLEINKDLSQ